MTVLHVIYREAAGGRWQTYSRPDGIHVGGDSLAAVRRELHEAIEFHFDDEWPQVVLVEHLERVAAPGLVIRTALDDKTAARDRTSDVVERSLSVPESLAIVRAQALESSTGDVVFVCCEPDDPIRWVSAQLGLLDAVQVVAPVVDGGIWWMPLATPGREVALDESETLVDAGLDGENAVVGQMPVAAERHAERAPRHRPAASGPSTLLRTLPVLVAA